MVGKLLGHYEILEPLGAGGMGEVYRARDTTLERQVAIKLLPQELADDPDRLARFEREAKLLAALNHPHIATIHGVGHEKGIRFLVMELVDGTSLTSKLHGGALPTNEALAFSIQVAQALEAAHKENIVHRDLKPDNVLLTSEGQVKLVDFGIAKESHAGPGQVAAEDATNLTATGAVVGTPTYMSPEQIRGEPVDQRTDVWAFGCLLFEALSGTRAFGRATIADTYAAIVGETPDWSRLPESTSPVVRSLLRRCLTKDRKSRLRDIRDARLEIEDVRERPDTDGAPRRESPPGVVRTAFTSPGTWVGLAGIAVAVVAVAWALYGRDAFGPEPTGPPSVSIEQLTFTAGVDFGGTISPDGEWFAYAHQDEGEFSVHLQALGSRNPIPLGTGVSPTFSADGMRIAFSDPPLGVSGNAAKSGGGISVMGRTGDDQRQLTDFGFNPAWSPDGSPRSSSPTSSSHHVRTCAPPKELHYSWST